MQMKIRLSKFGFGCIVCVLILAGSREAGADSTHAQPYRSSIPYVPHKVVIVLAGSSSSAFNWKWPSSPTSSLDSKLLEVIHKDTKNLVLEDPEWNRFKLPAEVAAIVTNPATHLEYVVMIPHDAEGSLDMNVTYVYDLDHKEFVFKTYVDPEQ